MKQISDNEIYLLINYIKSALWRVAKRLSYIEDAQCLNVNKIQQDAIVCRYFFTANLLYIFWVSIAPIIRST